MLGASLTVVEDDESDKESVDKGRSMNPDPTTT
jgi:hypothetical protein